MNEPRIPPDDPRLTAYALGELGGDERAIVEAALRRNPALRLAVAEIRATAAQLEASLAREAILRPTERSAATAGIVIKLNGHAAESALAGAGASQRKPPGMARPASANSDCEYALVRRRPLLLGFPQFYYVIASAAAACFALLLALREPRPPGTLIVHESVRQDSMPAPANAALRERLGNPANSARAAEAHVGGADLPGGPDGAGAEARKSTGDARAARPTAAGPAFIDGGLSLIGQGGHGPPAQDESSIIGETAPFRSAALTSQQEERTVRPAAAAAGRGSPPAIFGGSAAEASAGASAVHAGNSPPEGPVFSVQGPLKGAGISSGATIPVPPLFSAEVLTPPVAAPVIAGSTRPSLVPDGLTSSRTSGGYLIPPNAGDVVVLSAFTVTADRAVGFATESGTTSAASSRRERTRHDDRPLAPPGAQFGRNTDAYSYIKDNDFVFAEQNPLSTFSIEVDAASYANVRRIIEYGSPPPPDAVRIEELLNYFPYRYPPPPGGAPFAATLEVANAPWALRHQVVRIGLKAREVSTPPRAPANLVFLLDVSGSMNHPNKLPLVKQALRRLLGRLGPDDHVAFVTYAGSSGLALASTPVSRSREILNALDALAPRGSANGAVGLQLAYDVAKAGFVRGGSNRVILCTDGDFNLGPASEGELVRLVSEQTASGVFLTVLGLGMGALKDATLEQLAERGRGDFGYIDTRREAEKLLVEQVNAALVTVAKDVKVQVEFNPATVARYRLIGYENRLLRKEDFNHDATGAGEIEAGHTVTALYEIVPVGAWDENEGGMPPVGELRYATRRAGGVRSVAPDDRSDPLNNELLTVKVRYKKPDGLFSFQKTLEFPLVNIPAGFEQASADFRFAAAVAQFGMILRGSPHRGTATMGEVAAWAAAASAPADDPGGFRREFVELVRKAQAIIE